MAQLDPITGFSMIGSSMVGGLVVSSKKRQAVSFEDQRIRRLQDRKSRESALLLAWRGSPYGRALLSELRRDVYWRVGSKAWVCARSLSKEFTPQKITVGLNRVLFNRVVQAAALEGRIGHMKMRLKPLLTENDWVVLREKLRNTHESDSLAPVSSEELQNHGFIIDQDGFIAVHRGQGRPTTPLAVLVHDRTLPLQDNTSKRRAVSKDPLVDQENVFGDRDLGDAEGQAAKRLRVEHDSSSASETPEDQEEATRAATPESQDTNGEAGKTRIKQHIRPESQRILHMVTAAPNHNRGELKQRATNQATEQQLSPWQQTDENNMTAANLGLDIRTRDTTSRLSQALLDLENFAEEEADFYDCSAERIYLAYLTSLLNEKTRRWPVELRTSDRESTEEME